MLHQPTPDCFDENQIIRYVEGELSDDDKERMEKHFNDCPACFEELADLTEILFSEESLDDFEQSYTPPTKSEVRKFLKHARRESNASSRWSFLKKLYSFWERFEESWSRKIPAPVLRVAVLVIFMVPSGFWAFRYYQTDYQISQARSILTENAGIYYGGAPRLTGGYKADLVDKTQIMSNDSSDAYLGEVTKKLDKALRNGADEVEALRLLAHAAMLKSQLARADSLLGSVLNQGNPTAEIYNDLGAVKYKLEKYVEADSFFSKATDLDSTRSEFLYNLAWTKKRTGRAETAKTLFTKCLALELTEEWRRAIESALADL